MRCVYTVNKRMYIQSNPARPQSATVSGTQNGPSAPTRDGQTAQRAPQKPFAMLFVDITELLQGVTPCAGRLYAWLLLRAKSGKPQEVHLEDFAKTSHARKRGLYSLAHIRRALDELLNIGLVEQVFQYSGKIFKLIAHDDRTFSPRLSPETSTVEIETSKKSASNPDCCGIVNKENSEIKTNNPPNHPVSTDKPGKDGGALNGDAGKGGALEPSLKQPEKCGPVLRSDALGSTSLSSGVQEAEDVLESLPIAIQAEIFQTVEQTLERPLNPQIRKTLLQQTINGVRNALNAFQEAKQRQTIKNPLGWLTAAVRDRFTPNATKPNHSNNPTKTPPEGFREWFELAQPLGIAIGSGFMGGVFHVHTPKEAIAWDDIHETWPLTTLQQMQTQRFIPHPPTPSRPSPPAPAPEIIHDPDRRASSLARLQFKYQNPKTREAAIAECDHWGFEIGPDGPWDVAF